MFSSGWQAAGRAVPPPSGFAGKAAIWKPSTSPPDSAADFSRAAPSGSAGAPDAAADPEAVADGNADADADDEPDAFASESPPPPLPHPAARTAVKRTATVSLIRTR